MAVLERSELEASSLADLHAIADQLGLDGFRRLRKAELIDAILAGGAPADRAEPPDAGEAQAGESGATTAAGGRRRPRRSPIGRLRRSARAAKEGAEAQAPVPLGDAERTDALPIDAQPTEPQPTEAEPTEAQPAEAQPSERGGPPAKPSAAPAREGARRLAEGVVELVGNGSAFLRVAPPEPSDEDVYISPAQVRRCALVSGDRVSGPVRTPRRSERYSSLVRIDTINGAAADTVAEAGRYEDLAVAYPSERLELGAEDPTLQAIEWLTPLGRGSRAVITGAAHAGKTETLRRLLAAVYGREDLEVTLVLAGARPEEIADWRDGPVAPTAALDFAASADLQGQAVERAVDVAKRVAARGGDALVLIDGLDGVHPHAARKVLAAARNLRDGGSLTIIATAARPFGGETTVIALDLALTSTGRQPILHLPASGTLKPELLVGEEGAHAITNARAAALDGAG
jgi:transcription termination factor Rho